MSAQPGLGVMIGMLSGSAETVETVRASLGKKIESVELKDNQLVFQFTDGTGMSLYDDGQSCCEHRYMETADDLSEYSGHTLVNIEVRGGPCEEDDWGGMNEIQFLDITTDKGFFQLSNHNEHNGYYGGFWIVAKPQKP